MADLRKTQRELAATRKLLSSSAKSVETAGVKTATARAALVALQRSGAPQAKIRAAKQTLAQTERLQKAAITAETKARLAIDRLRTDLFAVVTPESLVAQLDGQVPIVMFPVRLETRYSDDRRTLRIRIFPDASNVHSHEPALTELELKHGKEYWITAWSGETDDQSAAWSLIAGRRGAPRARYIVDMTRPTNVAALGTQADPIFPTVPTKAEPWTLPPRAAALPDRFLAIGFRGRRPIFSKWGNTVPDELNHGPAPDPTGEVEFEESELPIDDGMRWMVDYQEAEKLGMAITIGPRDHRGRTTIGAIDELFVIGLDVTMPPKEAAARIEALFGHHLHTEGMEFLKPGTPTNNTSRVRSAYDSSPTALTDSLDPADTEELGPDTAARNLATALGLSPDAFDDAPNGAMADQGPARDMNDVLWEASWGYYFDHLLHPSVTDAQAAAIRSHFRDFVRGRGPLPTVRIGDQPYGFLPVQAFDKWAPDRGEQTEKAVADLLQQAKGFWSTAASDSPRIGRTGDPDDDLLDVLRFTPRSSSFRFRSVTGGVFSSNLDGFDELLARSEAIGQLLLATLHVENTPLEITHAVMRPQHRRLSIPVVQREDLSETNHLVDNYITQIAARVRREGGLDEFKQRSFWFESAQMQNLTSLRLAGILQVMLALEPPSLLEALLGHAATIEIAKASARLLDRHEVETGIKSSRATKVTPVEAELVTTDATTLMQFTEAKAPSIAGTMKLGDFLATAQLHQRPETRALNDFVQALRRLADIPSAELERLFLDTLDTTGTRLDAWVTSFATRRLAQVRAARPQGSHIGAFGWVENLKPDATPDSLGYIHAPSLPQAAAAAILRSGHLSHRGSDAELLSLDLSSERVRVALTVLDGARQGQRLTALLGYRFERNIRERSAGLAKYILPFRKACPLATAVDGEPTKPVETIAARDVVDGLKLLERYRTNQSALFSTVGVSPQADRTAIAAELDRLDSIRDAVSDVLVAEGVYQTVLGNTERAGAALAAIDQQAQPVEPEVVNSPRTGTTYTHRVMVLLQDQTRPPGWTTQDLRARSAPRANNWIGRALGNPRRIRFAADVLDESGNRIRGVELRLSDLALSPLTVLAATARGGSDRTTELEQRVAVAMSAKVSNPDAASLVLYPGRLASWPARSVGLIELLSMCAALRDVISGSRAADGRDFAIPNDDATSGVNIANLAARADTAAAGVQHAATTLEDAITDGSADDLRDAIGLASGVGAIGGVAVSAGSTPADVEQLKDQATVVLDALTTTLAKIADPPPTALEPLVAHHVARLKAIFGEDYPVLPVFSAHGQTELSASVGNKTKLLADESLAATTWLHRMSHVQANTGRLWSALNQSEMAGGAVDATQLHVMQLPHLPEARWLALPFENGTPVDAEVSIVAHSPQALNPAQAMAGVVTDEWVETVPGVSETTGVSFHYDAPGARPPQTVLLAVPPGSATKKWSVDLVLETVRDALELTKVRSADPTKIPHIGRFLPALYFAQNTRGTTPTINFSAHQDLQDALERAEREQ